MRKNKMNVSLLSLALLLTIAWGFTGCKAKKNVSAITTTEEVDTTVEDDDTDMDEAENADASDEADTVEKQSFVKKLTKEQQLANYFGAVATAASVESANTTIEEALSLFGSPEAPVLIVIYKAGSAPDYDEPTTIEKYLNYLKDTKNNEAVVEEIIYNDNGTIKELVLKK